jgi:hypothetical protein
MESGFFQNDHGPMKASSRWKFPQQRTKRERQQPSLRSGAGFLEKKKDYLQRAARAHRKAEFVRDLEHEAAQRNPDEFYFSMITDTRNRSGARDVVPPGLNKEQRLLLQTRDRTYVQMKLQSHRKKLDALLARLPREMPPPTRFFASWEEATATWRAKGKKLAESGGDELRKEVAERQRIVRELEEVLAEMQLRKDMNDGETMSTVDEEGNVSIVWKKERKR